MKTAYLVSVIRDGCMVLQSIMFGIRSARQEYRLLKRLHPDCDIRLTTETGEPA